MRRSGLLLTLAICIQIGSLGACSSPADRATDDQDSDKRLPIVLAINKHGEDRLGRMLDSLLKGKAEPECFYGRFVAINKTVVGPFSACLVRSADTSVYYFTERGLTQREAAALMGIDQPKVSHILRGRLADFSTERLMNFLTGLGRDVEIVVKPSPRSRKKGRLRVAVA